jgi:hypothetical protein
MIPNTLPNEHLLLTAHDAGRHSCGRAAAELRALCGLYLANLADGDSNEPDHERVKVA